MECVAHHTRVPPFQNTVEYLDARARVKSQNGHQANELFIDLINETWDVHLAAPGAKRVGRRDAENANHRCHASIRQKRWGPLMFETANELGFAENAALDGRL